MPTSDCFVSVVAVLYNDSDIVEEFLREVSELVRRHYENYEIVLVDDGSKDDTVARVEALLQEIPCVRLIQLSRRFGDDIAISAGLDTVIGDFVVVMKPDSDPVALIPEMVSRCRAGAGVVYGVCRRRDDEPFCLRMGRSIFYWLANRIFRMDLAPDSTDFRVYSRQVVNAITRIRDRLRYVRTLAGYVGYGSESVPYERIRRRAAPRHRSLIESVSLAVRIIVANSTHPLRIISLVGFGLSFLSVVHILYVFLTYALSEHVVEGWATSMLHSSVMFMFVFLILATLCEYVGRLLDEVKDRPLYYVREERSSSVMLADESRKNVVTDSREI